MMRRRAAPWIVGFTGSLVLALLASVACGGDGETGAAAARVGPLEITNAYASRVMDGGAVYFTTKNTGDEDDALTGVSADVAGEAQLHTTVTEDTTARTQPVAEIEIPAKGETTLQPGGYYVMLMDLEEPLQEGDTISVELTFERAGSATIRATVTSFEESQAVVEESEEVVTIRLRNKFFDPPVVVIHEGDKVIWVMETRGGWHNVESYEGEFSSQVLEYGHAFAHTFHRPGVYGFYCIPHVIDGMQGAVVVLPKEAPLPDPLPSPPALTSWSGPTEPVAELAPDTIVTVAGGAGAGGPATNSSLFLPEGVALDDAGRLYIADTENCQIRSVGLDGTIVTILGHESCGSTLGAEADLGPWLHTNHPRGAAVGPDGAVYVADTINCLVRVLEGGVATTFAGNGSCHASGDGGPAAKAGLSPWALAWDRGGNLYVADVFNCRIRKVDEEGLITTVAGDGTCGFSGDGGPATQASLFFPRDVTVGPDDALYLADTENCRVRRVDPANGLIETVAGAGDCDFSGDGGPALEAGLHPWAVAVDSDSDVLVADRENCRLRRFVPGGTIATVAGTGLCGFSGDGGPAAQATLNWPSDLALAADDAIYVADTSNCRVRRIEGGGSITTVAGTGVCERGGDSGPATSAGVWHAMGLAVSEQSEFYFSELDTCRVRRVGPDGIIDTVAGTGICGFSGDGGPATQARLSDLLGGLALDDDGILYFAEGSNCRVRRVAPNGVIDTVAGTGHCGFSGDGGPARQASLDFVSDVALDGSGALYLAEPYNCRARRVDLATGIINTVAGDGSCRYNGEDVPAEEAGVDPWGVAVGPDGALYLADGSNCRVRRVGAEGRITTVAGGEECGYAGDGGPATEAQLLRPNDVVVDQAGNLYTADMRNFTVRKVDRRGIISTVAGVGITRPLDVGGFDARSGLFCSLESLGVPAPSYLGDGGPANEGGLYFPYAVALGHDGHLYIGDTFDHRVRRVTCGASVPCVGPTSATTLSSPGSPDRPAGVIGLPSAGHSKGPEGTTPTPGLLAGIGAVLVLLGAALRLLTRTRLRVR